MCPVYWEKSWPRRGNAARHFFPRAAAILDFSNRNVFSRLLQIPEGLHQVRRRRRGPVPDDGSVGQEERRAGHHHHLCGRAGGKLCNNHMLRHARRNVYP